MPVQFAHYLAGIARGEMGTSLFTRRPISEDLLNRQPATMELAIYAMIVAVAGGKRNAASLDKRTETRCETPMN